MVQLIENNPIFVDVDKDNPSDVYIAYALCEGEVGAVYDVYIEDQPSVCLDQADSDARDVANIDPNDPDANNVSVYCAGRANKGDVISGQHYLDEATELEIPFQDLFDQDYNYNMIRDGANFSRPLYLKRLGTDYNIPAGDPRGITHETQYSFNSPIAASLMFHAGKPDQDANQELLELSMNGPI